MIAQTPIQEQTAEISEWVEAATRRLCGLIMNEDSGTRRGRARTQKLAEAEARELLRFAPMFSVEEAHFVREQLDLQLQRLRNPPWVCPLVKKLIARLPGVRAISDDAAFAAVETILDPDSNEDEKKQAQHGLEDIKTRLTHRERIEIEWQLANWSALGPPWHRDLACEVIVAMRHPDNRATNPFGEGVRHTTSEIRRLLAGPRTSAAVFQAFLLCGLWLMFVAIYPLGILPAAVDAIWRLATTAYCRIKYKHSTMLDRMPDTFALGVYLGVLTPIVIVASPLLILGITGHRIAGYGRRPVAADPF